MFGLARVRINGVRINECPLYLCSYAIDRVTTYCMFCFKVFFVPSQVKLSPNQSLISSVPMSSASDPTMSVPFQSENSQRPQNTFGNILEKEMEFDNEVIPGSQPHYQRPPPEIPSQYLSRVSRVEHLERMLEKLDQEQVTRDKHRTLPPEHSPHGASSYPEQHMKAKLLQSHSSRMTTRGPPMDGQRPMPMMERDYMYHEGEHRVDVLPPPNIGIRPQGGMNRSNHWAVEMERRRLIELKQIERARMERAMYNNSMHGGMQHKVGIHMYIRVHLLQCL